MIQTTNGVYESLSRLLVYPTETIKNTTNECREHMQRTCSSAAEAVVEFSEFVNGSTVSDLQELYTRTFEINPVCALEVGWQLFGERYERGTFIVKMRGTLRELDLPESSELPDHLVHVLQALDRLQPDEAREFASLFLVPAVDKMLDGFKQTENAYCKILNAINCEVRDRYNLPAKGVSGDD